MKETSRTKLGLRPVGVMNIKTDALMPNPHNPRMLFDRDPMRVLKESISKVGILVPLTVYFSSAKHKHIILDGQRRWICAQELGLKEVPVNEVAEPTLVQNIVTMFQIHKLRQDWDLMPTALKVEVLMINLKERADEKLAQLTGLDPAMVARCKKLLSYEKKYQDLMLDPEPSNRVRADFFIELHTMLVDRTVKKLDWYKRSHFIDRMLRKYKGKSPGLKAVTDFRRMKQFVSMAVKAGKTKEISKRLHEFVENDELTIDHLLVSGTDSFMVAKRIRKLAMDVSTELRNIDLNLLYGEEDLWKTLIELSKLIEQRVREAGWSQKR